MSKIAPHLNPAADPEAIVLSDQVRFTVLTDRMIRMEFDPDRHFEDRASLAYWYRCQSVPPFSVTRADGWLTIETDHLKLHFYENNRFHWRDLWIELKKTGQQWRYGDADFSNLGGTIRTLDSTRGPVSLDKGLVSRSGWALIDDSKNLVLDQDQWPAPREKSVDYKDLYFYGYGQDYLAAIKDHQLISGKPGLLPRWSLGNWWSRYWAYSADDMTTLMAEFEQKKVPLSVCIIDMDWHKTETNNASSGWTGYSWNNKLFPNPEGFIAGLHKRNLKTALNLHPAEGVHNHEDRYSQMATRMGVEPALGTPIAFDIANPRFAKAYFEILHHPLEQQGVDFWWLDWQQGSESRIDGLDPLFWLNHLHFYDQGKTHNKRPFIFSRWPGLGGQRYPIGFSGDTVVDWSTLKFQPYMTATASNVAYGWWSHDIGGHCEGVEEPELFLRWVQFGAFSPIFRLHSTNNEYIDRLPWSCGLDIFQLTRSAMQLRRQLIPFIYTANERNARTGEPLILPMYYTYPEQEEAYTSQGQYLFGQKLLVAPVTSPINQETGFARKVVWLAEGTWTNIFTHEAFEGGAWYSLYCEQADIPVFAQAGTILPLDTETTSNGVDLPTSFKVKLFAGQRGQFELYEDAGEGQSYLDGDFCRTLLTQKLQNGSLQIRKQAARGDFTAKLPPERTWHFEIIGITEPTAIQVNVGNAGTTIESVYDPVRKTLALNGITCANNSDLEITLEGVNINRFATTPVERVGRFIRSAQLPSLAKQQFMRRLPEILADPLKILDIAHTFTRSQLLALYENVVPASLTKPSEDLYSAFETMMMNLRKLRTG